MRESAFLFPCDGEELVGIVAAPEHERADTGVLVVVGGPQYRIGSHRQFVSLSRELAAAGIPCMRFDYRGMGDATGDARPFDTVDADIAAAVDAFFRHQPGLSRVVLWGLCDGASAACFYAPSDPRIGGLVLLNPWVRTPAGEARTYLRHYYLKRLADPAFWKKLLAGRLSLGRSLDGLVRTAQSARESAAPSTDATLPGRMAASLASADRPFTVILSGRDYVAREFEGAVSGDPRWTKWPAVSAPQRLDEADHTFSSAALRSRVAHLTVEWIRSQAPSGDA